MRTSFHHRALRLAPIAALAAAHFAQPAFADAPSWRAPEADNLRNHVQITFPDRFSRAGEAYFSPDTRWIIFQATPRAGDDQAPPNPHFSMYVAKLERNDAGRITGIEEPILISPPGSANTCGFFHPKHHHRVIFGSTLTPPEEQARAGYQRGASRYVWQFPPEMQIVTRTVLPIFHDLHGEPQEGDFTVGWGEDAKAPQPLWTRHGYDAECAYSPDGRFIVYTAIDEETGDGSIRIYDTKTDRSWPVVTASGYDGGPFFSPCGRRICYRSDRKGNNLLQLFVADLEFDADGVPIRVKTEHQLTNNRHVNWAPFWHPDGEHLVYASSEAGHDNYEVFSIEAPAYGAEADSELHTRLTPRRITHAPGFDGLPVFNTDGDLMMWTSQRGGLHADDERPSSQVWIAEVVNTAP